MNQAVLHWQEFDINIDGFNIGSVVNTSDEQACQQLCQNNSNCDWYSYNTDNKTCTLNKLNF